MAHVSWQVPRGWAGRTGPGSPTGKTRFSRRRRRPGGNGLAASPSGPPSAPPFAQPRRGRRRGGRQLAQPGVTRSHAGPAPRSRPSRPHRGAAWRPRGCDSAEPQCAREEATWGGEGRPERGPVAKKPDPRLGPRPWTATAQLPLSLPPYRPEKPSGAAVLRRPQAETRTLDCGSQVKACEGCLAWGPAHCNTC